MTCPSSPGWCDGCNRRVRWADLQICMQNRNYSETPNSCLACIHAGPIINDATGKPIGSTGCGCGGTQATGNRWITCGVTSGPVLVTRAAKCGDFSPA